MTSGVYVRSEETRAKLSRVNMGKRLSKEHRIKLSLAHIGKPRSEDTKAKISLAHTGKHLSEVTKTKISLGGKGNRNALGCHRTKAQKAKLSRDRTGVNNPWYGKCLSKETKTKMSKAHRLLWQDSEWKTAKIKSLRSTCHIHPNKPETALLALLESAYPNEWAFVGDGSLIIDGFNPDFVNVNGKKLIVEMFGEYWHGEGKQLNRRSDEERVRAYASLGYSTLIVWGSELKDPTQVLKRIANFAQRGVR